MKPKTALDVIHQIRVIVSAKPRSSQAMLEDMKVMQFKIRPVDGDIGKLNGLDDKLIYSLWKIGKIDELVRSSFKALSHDDKETLISYLREFESRTQQEIMSKSRKRRDAKSSLEILKLEIFKDKDKRLPN